MPRVLAMSVLQGRGPRTAMFDAMGDLVEAFQAIPEHLPLLLLDASVAFGVIERIDRIAAARAPEQARVFVAHDLPHRATEAFALRFVEHGELVEIGETRLIRQERSEERRVG